MNSTEEELIQIRMKIQDNVSAEFGAIKDNFGKSMYGVSSAASQAQSSFRSLGDQIKGSFVTAVKGAILAYAGFEIINKTVRFMADARNEAKAYAMSANQLTFSIAGNTKELREQAAVLGKKLMIDGADIISAQARFSVYEKNSAQIKKAIPTILDFAKAQGLDLASAANIVGRALADDNNELGRYHISISGAINSNERLDSILKSINSTMGGQAEAAILSADSVDKLNRAWKNFKEGAGKLAISPAEEMYERNKTIMADYLADLSTMSVYQQMARTDEYNKAKEFNDKYEELMAKSRANIANAANAQGQAQFNKMMADTAALQKRVNDLTENGKIKEFQIERDAEIAKLDLHMDYENRRKLVTQFYAGKINEIRTKQKDDEQKRQKENDKLDIELKSIDDYNKTVQNAKYAYDESGLMLQEQSTSRELALFDLRAQKELEAYKGNTDAKKLMEGKFVNDRIALDKKLTADQAKLQKEAAMGTLSTTVQILQAMSKKHREAMALWKIAAISEAIINTKSSAIAAYKSMVGVPLVGPVIAPIAAGAAIAYGMYNVADIVKQQFAYGTTYSPGGLARVGERGEEVVNLPRGSSVYSNTEVRNASSTTQLIFNNYDQSGNLSGTLKAQIHAGDGEALLSILRDRL